ncbi:MAG: hypothetical protein IPK03_15685 [Bacteroidetes bacterium]|nr:hypothetical protein [Bacteroidota bacterium]
MVIDQTTAHERILFDKYQSFFERAKNATQKLLFPINLHLNASDASLLQDLLPEISIIGFEMEHFGQNDFIIHGIPADFAPGREIKIIEEVLEQYKMNAKTEQISPRENISKSMAWSNSIKWGKKLSIPEMQTLIEDLFASSNPYYGPRGNKTFTKFDLEEIDRRFV